MMISDPANPAAVDAYAEVLKDELRGGGDGSQALEYYKAHQSEIEAGVELSWPERKAEGDASPVQTALNLKIINPSGFEHEYQCEPEETRDQSQQKTFDALAIQQRVSGLERYQPSPGSTRITAFIDLGSELLWWCVVSWNESFGGSVIDYGVYPDQPPGYFDSRDPRPGMSYLHKSLTDEQRVYAGLSEVLPRLLDRFYGRAQIDQLLVDVGWKPAPVYEILRVISQAGRAYGSKGIGRSATQVGVAKWKKRAGERTGHHWKLTNSDQNRGRQLQFDPDEWKTFIWNACNVPLGGPNSLTLFGNRPITHELFCAHLASEYSQEVVYRGDRFDKWGLRPDSHDNHWLDCLVGCAVAASVSGLEIPVGNKSPVAIPNKPIKLSELYRQKHGRRG